MIAGWMTNADRVLRLTALDTNCKEKLAFALRLTGKCELRAAALCAWSVQQPVGESSDELVKAAYGPNYARLTQIKKKYNPGNVLRLNQNIKPS